MEEMAKKPKGVIHTLRKHKGGGRGFSETRTFARIIRALVFNWLVTMKT